ncbi:MAG: hypothetical protein AB4041_14280 [Microcystaceae cyanobacterium]
MTTHFITAEIDLTQDPLTLKQTIEQELQSKGTPLRWAMTKVDTEKQTGHIEGIVTTDVSNNG